MDIEEDIMGESAKRERERETKEQERMIEKQEKREKSGGMNRGQMKETGEKETDGNRDEGKKRVLTAPVLSLQAPPPAAL